MSYCAGNVHFVLNDTMKKNILKKTKAQSSIENN